MRFDLEDRIPSGVMALLKVTNRATRDNAATLICLEAAQFGRACGARYVGVYYNDQQVDLIEVTHDDGGRAA